MKKEYDLSKMKMRKNPYASKLKRQVTIRMGDDVVTYFLHRFRALDFLFYSTKD